ncbi:GNAT family N-acetyltransferase [Myroides sp. LJL116]
MNIAHEDQTHKGLFMAFIDTHRAGEMAYHIRENTIVIDHTMVKSKYRQKGVGTELFLKGLIHYVKEHSLKIVSCCSFVDAMLQKYPEYKEFVSVNPDLLH